MELKIFLFIWTIIIFIIGILLGYFIGRHTKTKPKKKLMIDLETSSRSYPRFDLEYYMQMKPYRDLLRKHL